MRDNLPGVIDKADKRSRSPLKPEAPLRADCLSHRRGSAFFIVGIAAVLSTEVSWPQATISWCGEQGQFAVCAVPRYNLAPS